MPQLGLSPRPVRALGLALAVALATGAVALAGALAFVGLVVPHVARAVCGADPDSRGGIVASTTAQGYATSSTVCTGHSGGAGITPAPDNPTARDASTSNSYHDRSAAAVL